MLEFKLHKATPKQRLVILKAINSMNLQETTFERMYGSPKNELLLFEDVHQGITIIAYTPLKIKTALAIIRDIHDAT